MRYLLLCMLFLWLRCFSQEIKVESPLGTNPVVLYAGLETLLSIDGIQNNYTLGMKRGWIRKTPNGLYSISERYCDGGKKDTLEIYTPGEVIKRIPFQIVYSKRPMARAVVGDECKKYYTKKDLQTNPVIHILPDSLGLEVESFTYYFDCPRCDATPIQTVIGNKIMGSYWDVLMKTREFKRREYILISEIKLRPNPSISKVDFENSFRIALIDK
ncbi:MAG: hypothetical protein J0L80_17150 [Chitinophagales bacterium]|nr:hypothetical protein [Chitinophagales bacterium]